MGKKCKTDFQVLKNMYEKANGSLDGFTEWCEENNLGEFSFESADITPLEKDYIFCILQEKFPQFFLKNQYSGWSSLEKERDE